MIRRLAVVLDPPRSDWDERLADRLADAIAAGVAGAVARRAGGPASPAGLRLPPPSSRRSPRDRRRSAGTFAASRAFARCRSRPAVRTVLLRDSALIRSSSRRCRRTGARASRPPRPGRRRADPRRGRRPGCPRRHRTPPGRSLRARCSTGRSPPARGRGPAAVVEAAAALGSAARRARLRRATAARRRRSCSPAQR